MILALVLGPLMETNLRRALSLANGDPGILIGSPLAIGLWVMVLVSLVLPFVTRRTPAGAVSVEADTADESDSQPID